MSDKELRQRCVLVWVKRLQGKTTRLQRVGLVRLAAVAMLQAFLGLDVLDGQTTAAVSGGLVAVYTVMRTLAKIRGAA